MSLSKVFYWNILLLNPDVSLGPSGKNNEKRFKLGTLFGTEHPWFWKVHITALISLGKYRRKHIYLFWIIITARIEKFCVKVYILNCQGFPKIDHNLCSMAKYFICRWFLLYLWTSKMIQKLHILSVLMKI